MTTEQTRSLASEIDSVSEGRPSSDSWWKALALITFVVLVAMNVIVAQTAIAPRTPWDEIFPLETARQLAGKGPVTELAGKGYYPGWAILLTPIWWFTSDPHTVYHAAVILSILLSLFTVLPLSRILVRLSLSKPQALLASSLALLMPARIVNADYALSENLLTLLYVLAVLAAIRLWEDPSALTVSLFALSVTAAYVTHVRAFAIVVAALVWLVLVVRRNWKVAFLGMFQIVGGYYLVKLLVAVIVEPLLLGGFGQSDNFFAHLSQITFGLVTRVALSQLWAQLAGSFGIFGLGLVVVAVLAWREVRRLDPGPSTFLLGLFLITFGVSVIAWSNPGPQDRLDAQLYTRYIDPVGLLVVACALAVLLRISKRWVLISSTALSLLIVLVVCLRVAPWANTWGTDNGPANSAAVLAWFRLRPPAPFSHPLFPLPGNANQMWFWASLSILCGAVVLLVLRQHARVLSVVLLVSVTVLSWFANPSQSRDYPEPFVESLEEVEQALGVPSDTLSVDFDLSCHGPNDTFSQVLNWSSFWLYPRRVEGMNPTKAPFDSKLVISCDDWPEAEQNGALQISESDYYTYALWVLPGDIQDTLERQGLLMAH